MNQDRQKKSFLMTNLSIFPNILGHEPHQKKKKKTIMPVKNYLNEQISFVRGRCTDMCNCTNSLEKIQKFKQDLILDTEYSIKINNTPLHCALHQIK